MNYVSKVYLSEKSKILGKAYISKYLEMQCKLESDNKVHPFTFLRSLATMDEIKYWNN